MKQVLTMKPPHPNSEADQALLHWAEAVALLLYLPRRHGAQLLSGVAGQLRQLMIPLPEEHNLLTLQIRYINQLLGFQLLPQPRRRWRFGPDYGAMRMIGGESGG